MTQVSTLRPHIVNQLLKQNDVRDYLPMMIDSDYYSLTLGGQVDGVISVQVGVEIRQILDYTLYLEQKVEELKSQLEQKPAQ